MLKLIIILIVVLLAVLWLARKACKIARPQESQQEFPSLQETVTTPKEDISPKIEWYNLNGVPYKVYESKSGAKYIERKKGRDGSIYKAYLNQDQKAECYYE